jgi:hypothetical protein
LEVGITGHNFGRGPTKPNQRLSRACIVHLVVKKTNNRKRGDEI